VFSACRDNQTSSDATDNSGKAFFGAFTNAFLESLRKNMHNIQVLPLYRDICMYLANQGFSQIPVLSTTTKTPSASIVRSVAVISPNVVVKPSSFSEMKQAVKKNMMSVMYGR